MLPVPLGSPPYTVKHPSQSPHFSRSDDPEQHVDDRRSRTRGAPKISIRRARRCILRFVIAGTRYPEKEVQVPPSLMELRSVGKHWYVITACAGPSHSRRKGNPLLVLPLKRWDIDNHLLRCLGALFVPTQKNDLAASAGFCTS